GEIVYLRNNSNISTGGDAIDVTDDIGQETKDLVAKAASSIPGLRACGIDVIINNDSIYILEINAHPMFSMHHYLLDRNPHNVVRTIRYILKKYITIRLLVCIIIQEKGNRVM